MTRSCFNDIELDVLSTSHFATYSLRGAQPAARRSFHPNFPFARSTPLSNIANEFNPNIFRRKFSAQKFHLCFRVENSRMRKDFFLRYIKHFRQLHLSEIFLVRGFENRLRNGQTIPSGIKLILVSPRHPIYSCCERRDRLR